MLFDFLVPLALMARQTARLARRHPELNDLADALFVLCVRFNVPAALLPR
jgi:hypothetical protein